MAPVWIYAKGYYQREGFELANKKKKRQEEGSLKEEIERETHKEHRVLHILGGAFGGLFRSFWATFTSLFMLGLVILFGLYLTYAQGFANAKLKNNTTQNIFYDKNGGIIYESFGTSEPERLQLDQIPDVVKNATLAAEDADFYQHAAIDPKGLARAAVVNIKNSQKLGILKLTDLFEESAYTQGGSTITQQLVKNVYLTNEHSFDRKLKEVIYSFELEKKWSKDRIFEEYLNNVYYGQQALGVQKAAKNYFGKDASELTLPEASMLAGLTSAPSEFDPINGDLAGAKKRQEYVLSKMVNQKMITYNEAKEAANAPLEYHPQKKEQVLKYPYFVQYVKEEVIAKIGQDAFDHGGIKVYTSLDPERQDMAEAKAQEYIKKFAYRKVTNTAIVVLDNKDENIAAMVGGVDWEKSKVNVATSVRQPGSSFKPLVYATGLLSGYSAASRLLDTAVNFGGNPPYRPKNYDGSYHGIITVRRALANSLNVPTVEMTKLVGVEKVIETASNLGITSIKQDPKNYGLSIGLGSAEVSPLEMARAYSAFANGGQLGTYSGIKTIVDSDGTEIYTQQKYETAVIDKRIAFIMTSILSDNQARSMVFGTNNPLTLKDRKVCAKTGTTDDFADSWTIGFTPQYTAAVWMGNNDHSTMAKISGIEGAAYIWHDVMEGIHKGVAAEDFIKPNGLSEIWINPQTGQVATIQKAPNILEYFIPGTETKLSDVSYLKQFGIVGTTTTTTTKR